MTKKIVPKLRFEFSSSWESKKLKDIIQISKEKYNPDSDKTNYKCIELEHLAQETGLLLGYTDSINQNSIKNKFHEDNILFGKLRPYLKKFYYTNFVGVCSSEIWVFDTNEYSKYIYYLIQTKKFLDISNVSAGSKMPRSDWNFMKNFVFSIPDIKTQKEIANLFSMIDNKIELLEKKYQQYQNFKKYLMQQIFTQKLRFNFSDEWEKYLLGDISSIGKGFTPSTSNPSFWDGDLKWLSIADMNQGKYINQTTKKITSDGSKNKEPVKKGTLLMSFKLSIGKLGILTENMYTNEAICNFKWKNKDVLTEYMYYYLSSINILKYGSQAAKGITLNNETLSTIPVLLPSLEEQKKIINILSDVDLKISMLENSINDTSKFKKGLLQQMFA